MSFTTQQLDEFKRVFDLFDTDNSGTININELDRVFENAGVQADQLELHNILQTLAGVDNTISFEEFIIVMSTTYNSTEMILFKDLVEDISYIQKEFLPDTDLNQTDDMSQIVKVLRDSMASLTTNQVIGLIKFHKNQFESYQKLQQNRVGNSTARLLRKVVAEEGIPSYFEERYGNPALGGFYADARATAGLNSHQIIAQLGLDYSGSTFLVNGNPKDVVYIIEAEMEAAACSVPLDPRVRSKVNEIMNDANQDAEIRSEAKELYENSHDCAVNDGSDTGKLILT